MNREKFMYIRPQYQKLERKSVVVAAMPANIIDKYTAGQGLMAHIHVEMDMRYMPYLRLLHCFNQH